MSPQRILLASLASLLFLPACTLVDQRNAIELRGVQGAISDGASDEIDEPIGAGVVFLGMLDTKAYLPVAFEVGVQQQTDDGDLGVVEQDLEQTVGWVGVRGELLTGHFRPHLGTGLIYVDGELESGTGGEVTNVTDFSSLGLYVEVGSRLLLSNTFHLGIGFRQTFLLEDEVGGSDTEFDFSEVFASIGFTF